MGLRKLRPGLPSNVTPWYTPQISFSFTQSFISTCLEYHIQHVLAHNSEDTVTKQLCLLCGAVCV